MNAARIRARLLAAAFALATLGAVELAFAVDNTPQFSDPVLQARYYGLTHELRCMQCQSEALADSNVGLAADLRMEVHKLIESGKSDAEIRDYMVARYSEFILLRPRMSLRNLWLWAAPGLLLIAGIVVALRVLRRRARLPIGEEPVGDDPVS